MPALAPVDVAADGLAGDGLPAEPRNRQELHAPRHDIRRTSTPEFPDDVLMETGVALELSAAAATPPTCLGRRRRPCRIPCAFLPVPS